ncbi:MAG: head GIN domain-containing protein [Bacteroidota bacterium]
MKTQLKKYTNLIITLVFILMAGFGFSQTKGSGNVISENRSTADFTKIKLTCSADLFISQGSTFITVVADDNLINLIETKVENGTLVINVKGRGFRYIRKLEVHITMPDLSSVKNSGSGDITFENTFKAENLFIGISGSGDLSADLDVRNLEFKSNGSGDTELSGVKGSLNVYSSGSGDLEADGLRLEDCYLQNSGSGEIELSGKTNTLKIRVMGSGDFDGYNFTAVAAEVSSSGSSDITLNVVEQLNVVLNGSGDLTYRGSPAKVDVRTNGSGGVYQK